MKTVFKNKAAGFYLLLAGLVFAMISLSYYVSWASAHHAMNSMVIVFLGVGIAVNLLLAFLDSDFLVIALTALYSAAMFQLVVDSAGSFADAYQGIVMFGDPTQVGTILVLCALMGVGVLASIAAGFMKRKKV